MNSNTIHKVNIHHFALFGQVADLPKRSSPFRGISGKNVENHPVKRINQAIIITRLGFVHFTIKAKCGSRKRCKRQIEIVSNHITLHISGGGNGSGIEVNVNQFTRSRNLLDDIGHELENALIQRHRNLDTRIGGFDNFHGIFARHERGNANTKTNMHGQTLLGFDGIIITRFHLN